MNRLLITTALTLLAALAPGAPVPGDERPVSYYPVQKGSKWVYANGTAEGKVVVLTAVESKGGATVLTLVTQEAGGKTAPYQKVKLSDTGVFSVEVLGEPVDPPQCLLKLPVSNGQTWKESEQSNGVTTKSTYTAFGPEDVVVPAGRYKAIRVELEMEIALKGAKLDKPYRQTNWFAPGVGCVKQTAGEAVEELKSFTPGEAGP
jgi:hypothetical protein